MKEEVWSMNKTSRIFNSDRPALKSDDFSTGISFEAINFKALQRGDQIVICKTGKGSDRIVLISKKEYSSDYVPSSFGRALMSGPVHHDSTRYIAEIISIDIPGDKQGYWRDLFNNKEFCLWDPLQGGYLYFRKSKRQKMLFWILRVYELDFDLVRNKDFFYTGAMGNYRIDNPDTLMRIQSSFDNARVRPVLDEEEFLEKMSKILSITIKWDKLDDDDDS